MQLAQKGHMRCLFGDISMVYSSALLLRLLTYINVKQQIHAQFQKGAKKLVLLSNPTFRLHLHDSTYSSAAAPMQFLHCSTCGGDALSRRENSLSSV